MPPIVSLYPLSRQHAKSERVRVTSSAVKTGGGGGGRRDMEAGGVSGGFNKVEGKSSHKTETSWDASPCHMLTQSTYERWSASGALNGTPCSTMAHTVPAAHPSSISASSHQAQFGRGHTVWVYHTRCQVPRGDRQNASPDCVSRVCGHMGREHRRTLACTMHKHTDTYKQTPPPPLDVWLTNGGPRPIPLHLQQRRPESHGCSEPTDSPAHRFRQGGAGRDDGVWCHSKAEELGGGTLEGILTLPPLAQKQRHQHLFSSSTFHAVCLLPHTRWLTSVHTTHTRTHTHSFFPIVYLLPSACLPHQEPAWYDQILAPPGL